MHNLFLSYNFLPIFLELFTSLILTKEKHFHACCGITIIIIKQGNSLFVMNYIMTLRVYKNKIILY